MAPPSPVPLPVFHRGDDFYLYEKQLRAAIALAAPHAVSFLDGAYPDLSSLGSFADPAARFTVLRTLEADRSTVCTLLRQSLAPALRAWLDVPTSAHGDDPTRMWRAIARRFGRPDQMRLRALETQIEALRIEDLGAMSAVLDEWQSLTARHTGTLTRARANAHDVFEPELYVGRERLTALRRLGKMADHAQRSRWDHAFVDALRDADDQAVETTSDDDVDAIYDEAYIQLILSLEAIEERHRMSGPPPTKLGAMAEQSAEEEFVGDSTIGASESRRASSSSPSSKRRSFMRPLSILGLPVTQQLATSALADSPTLPQEDAETGQLTQPRTLSLSHSMRAPLSPLTYHPPNHERPRPHSITLLSARDWAQPAGQQPQVEEAPKGAPSPADRRASIIDSGYAGSNSPDSPNGGGGGTSQVLAFRRTPGTRPRSLFIPSRSRSSTMLETIHARAVSGSGSSGAEAGAGFTPPQSARRVSSPGGSARPSVGSLRSPQWNAAAGQSRRSTPGGVSRASLDQATNTPAAPSNSEPSWPGWREYAQGLGLDASLLYGSGVGGPSALSPTARFRPSHPNARSRAPSISARPRSLSFISPASSRHNSPRVQHGWLLPEWPREGGGAGGADVRTPPTYANVALGLGLAMGRRSASDDHGQAVMERRAMDDSRQAEVTDSLGLTLTPPRRTAPSPSRSSISVAQSATVAAQHSRPPGTRVEAETQTERTRPDGVQEPTRMFKKNRRPPRGNKTRSGLPKPLPDAGVGAGTGGASQANARGGNAPMRRAGEGEGHARERTATAEGRVGA